MEGKVKSELEFIEKLRTFILEEMDKFQIPAFSIALVDNQQIFWREDFGWQDKEKQLKISTNTVYRVGSISKLFTAVAIMQLQESGKLNIDAPITRYCPELTFSNVFEKNTPITLRHLLSHRSGILRESPVGNYFDDTEPTITNTVKSILNSKLIYPVGDKCKYSNLGPTVAGYILEKISGMSFESYIEDYIFKPLNMRSSSFLPNKPVIEKNLAKAYMVNFEGKFFQAPQFQLGTLPAGNLYSTISDLAKFMICIFNKGKYNNNVLLKVKTINEMLNVQFEGCEEPPEFGLGFAIGKFGEYKMFWHNGIVYGFASDFTGLIEPQIGVIVLNNVDSAVGFNEKIKLKALDILLNLRGDQNHPVPPEINHTANIMLSEYEGKYQSGKADAWIWIEGGQLFLKSMGVTKQIRPVMKDEFITDDRLNYGLNIQFFRDSEERIKLMQAGNVKYKKIKEYKPDFSIPSKWERFVGNYGRPHNILKIFTKDGKLRCLIEWFYEYPLQQVDDLVFAFPNYGLYDGEFIRFEQNEKGKITTAIAGFVNFEKIEETN